MLHRRTGDVAAMYYLPAAASVKYLTAEDIIEAFQFRVPLAAMLSQRPFHAQAVLHARSVAV
jgi:hypothetical protein